MIVRKGETGEYFYVVLEGKAGVFIDIGKEMITTISAGGIIGELSILDKQERSAHVMALGDMLLLEFEGQAFISLVKANNTIAYSMAQTLSRRLRNTLRTRKN
jgi:CRP-like cAMP-binding protein